MIDVIFIAIGLCGVSIYYISRLISKNCNNSAIENNINGNNINGNNINGNNINDINDDNEVPPKYEDLYS